MLYRAARQKKREIYSSEATKMSIKDKIWLLAHSKDKEDRREWAVLYWKWHDLTHRQVGGRLGKGKDWVQRYMSRIYKRFDAPPFDDKDEKYQWLVDNVFPALNEFLQQNPETIRGLPEPLEIEKDLLPPSPPAPLGPTPPAERPKTIDIIDFPSDRHRTPWRAILLVGLLILCLVGGVLGYGGYRYGVSQVMSPVVAITVVQAVTEIMPTPIPSETPVPTLTFTPLPTLSPTTPPTVTPSPTEFVPPENGILFEDNFDSGDLSAWKQVSGEWIVSNGQLTVLPSESDSYRWIALVRPEWRNYILSVTVYQPFQGSAAQEDVLVTVRNNTSQENYLGVPADYFGNVYWAFIGEGYFDKEPIAGENGDFDFETGSTMELEVLDDTYTLRINGREIQKITMSGYNSGGISLGTECNRSPCGSFDNVKVTYLP
jgi:hypothetical protein